MFSDREVSQVHENMKIFHFENIPRNVCNLLPYQQFLCSTGALIFPVLLLEETRPIHRGLCQTQVLNPLAELKCPSLQCIMQCWPELLITWGWSFQRHLFQRKLEQGTCDWCIGYSFISGTGFKKKIKKLQAQVELSKAVMIKTKVEPLTLSSLQESSSWSKRRLKANSLAGFIQSHINLAQSCIIFENVFWLWKSLQQFELSL